MITKVTMTLFINSNINNLFRFRSIELSKLQKLLVYSIFAVKFHYVKETHMMLVTFWRTLVKIFAASQHKRHGFFDEKGFTKSFRSSHLLSRNLAKMLRVLIYGNFASVQRSADFDHVRKTTNQGRGL